jgi:hypothetical protein
MPLWPYCFTCVEGMIVFDAVPMAVTTLPYDGGIGCPARRSSSGLRSNRSMWLARLPRTARSPTWRWARDRAA